MTATRPGRRGLGGALYRRALHGVFLLTRGLTVGVRAIVRSEDGKFLLVRHTYMPGWYFPGGGVERGQTAERALSDELAQETGLRLVGRPRLLGVYFNRDVSPRDHVLAYQCEVEGELPEKRASLEIAEIGYFGLDALPEGTDPGTERRMREIVEERERGEDW